MIVRRLVLSVAMIACTGGSAAVLSSAGETNHQLTGSWDISLSLERPYQLELKGPPMRRVCGTIGFVEANQQFDGGRQSAGVYDIDLAQIGLGWVNDTRFPAAVARQTDQNAGRSPNRDSVAITLNPDSQERIVLVGAYRVAEIDGTWTAQSTRGTASGRFTLRQRSSDSRGASC